MEKPKLEKIKEIRKKLEIIRRNKSANKPMVMSPPIYDKTYFKGIEWLNGLE